MKNKVFIYFLLISCSVFSQVPGYMGKRLSIGYSNNFFPSLLYPSSKSTDRGELGLNTTHCINIDYAIKKRTEFCVSVEFFKSAIARSDGYIYSNGTTNYNSAVYAPGDKTFIQLKSTNVSLGFKFFKQGFIAPVGKYRKLEFVLLSDKINYNRNSFYDQYYSSDTALTAFGTGEYEFKSFAIAFTFGRQRVLFNSIILDTGFRFGVSTNTVFKFFLDNLLDGRSTYDIESQFKQDVNKRLFAAQLFNFHIGIGFLAF